MARALDNFRWSTLPTVATYCVFRFEKDQNVKSLGVLRNKIVSRFGMPRSGVDRKISSNFPEAIQVILGIYKGKSHANLHDKEIEKNFRLYSISELEEIFEEIINYNLIKHENNLKLVAVEILKKSKHEFDLYYRLTIAQGLDITDVPEDLFEKTNELSQIYKIKSELEDDKYVLEVNQVSNINSYSLEDILELSKNAPTYIEANVKRYIRNPTIARWALQRANYKCEINPEHETFIKSSDSKPYVEPHHIIPLSEQKNFNLNLDNVENIISLCPNCHRQVHLGKVKPNLIRKESLFR